MQSFSVGDYFISNGKTYEILEVFPDDEELIAVNIIYIYQKYPELISKNKFRASFKELRENPHIDYQHRFKP